MARLDSLNRAEGLRFASLAADTTVGADEIGGPLHLAVAERKRRQKEAFDRCEKALQERVDDDDDDCGDGGSPLPHRARSLATTVVALGEAAGAPPPSVAAAVPASPIGECGGGGGGGDSGGGGGGGGDGGLGNGGVVQSPEELDGFREKLEADTIQLATASFEDEVKRLAADDADDVPPPVAIAEASPLPDDSPPSPRELTRSQLDLRRAAEIRAYARSLGRMLLRARKVLVEEIVQVSDHNGIFLVKLSCFVFLSREMRLGGVVLEIGVTYMAGPERKYEVYLV